jgi:rhodanese-related sulfurtransferase
MQRLIEFLSHHAYLAGGAFLAAAVVVVYELRARLDAFAAVSPMQAVRLMNQGALVIDLRPKEAFDKGHIGEARNVPADTLPSQTDALKKWRDKTVITYCETGRDGAVAARTLQKSGFSKVVNLEGGLAGWIKDNMPLARASGGAK